MSPEDSARATEARTQRHFDQELSELNELLVRMASLAEEQVRSALDAVKRRDAQSGQLTIRGDRRVDALAIDLRMLVATLKISNDLERVGDHAVNIAECALRLAEAFPVETPSELDRMADASTGMLRDAISAFISRDAELGRDVCRRDDE